MNECFTTPQHEKQIGYWVSEKGKCMKLKFVLINHSVMSCAINTISQLGLFKMHSKIQFVLKTTQLVWVESK